MNIKEFSKELEKRTLKFAVQIIRLSTTLPNTPEARVIRTQITKCGSSVGANYREAKQIKKIKLQSAKAKPVRPNFG
jgi:four helix bundle protein